MCWGVPRTKWFNPETGTPLSQTLLYACIDLISFSGEILKFRRNYSYSKMLLWGTGGAPCLAVSCEFKACCAEGRRGARCPGVEAQERIPSAAPPRWVGDGGDPASPPRPCPLCRGSRSFAGVLGRCWFRMSQPWPRGPSGGPSAATAPSSALAARLQARGPGWGTRGTPGYNPGGLRRAPSFLSRRKGSQPLGRAARFVFPRSNCC